MKAMMKAAAVVVGLLAFAAPALADSNISMMGYFRDGWATSSKGGPAIETPGSNGVFATPGMDYKLRLGNEEDNYGEWGLDDTVYKDKSGVEAHYGVMFDYDGTVNTSSGTAQTIGIQQNYVKIKIPQLAGATFWGGKQYYERENINMIDHFYLNLSDAGLGVENINTGFGILSFSVFGVQFADPANAGSNMMFLRPDIRLQGIPAWPGGTLLVDLNAMSLSRHSGLTSGQDEGGGFWGTLEWTQANILGGNNDIALQYASGADAGCGPGAPGFAYNSPIYGQSSKLDSNNSQFAVWEQLLLQPTNNFQIDVGATFQQKTFGVPGGTNITGTDFGIFTSPKFWVWDYFAIQGDLGYTSVKRKGEDVRTLVKWTIAPTLLPATADQNGFFVRPELRVFVSGGTWNAASTNAGIAGGSYGTDTSGVLYGVQAEGWF